MTWGNFIDGLKTLISNLASTLQSYVILIFGIILFLFQQKLNELLNININFNNPIYIALLIVTYIINLYIIKKEKTDGDWVILFLITGTFIFVIHQITNIDSDASPYEKCINKYYHSKGSVYSTDNLDDVKALCGALPKTKNLTNIPNTQLLKPYRK